ncbi:MAG TPA: hypothetical protein DCR57_03565, partial [Pasteurella multocida]|nr:hypothetical protein [Pasteurella multocida]
MERWFFIKREKAYYRKWTNRARGYVKEVIELKQNIKMVQVGRVSYSFCVSLTQSNNTNEQDYIDGLRVVGNWHDKASWKN